jgi:predicted transcriptional regulator
MTVEELRAVVAKLGGPERAAERSRIKPRTLYYLLAGERPIKPAVETLLRLLAEKGDA